MVIVYPIPRLLANPRIFYAVANYLKGADAETLMEVFYSMLEFGFDGEEDPSDYEFDAEEVKFESTDEGAIFTIQFDNGLMTTMSAVNNEIKAQITSEKELGRVSEIYREIVSAIEETDPDLEGDIALCSPPTPSNTFLLSPDGNHFVGDFHLLSDPDRQFHFRVTPLPEYDETDSNSKKYKAVIEPHSSNQ